MDVRPKRREAGSADRGQIRFGAPQVQLQIGSIAEVQRLQEFFFLLAEKRGEGRWSDGIVQAKPKIIWRDEQIGADLAAAGEKLCILQEDLSVA